MPGKILGMEPTRLACLLAQTTLVASMVLAALPAGSANSERHESFLGADQLVAPSPEIGSGTTTGFAGSDRPHPSPSHEIVSVGWADRMPKSGLFSIVFFGDQGTNLPVVELPSNQFDPSLSHPPPRPIF